MLHSTKIFAATLLLSTAFCSSTIAQQSFAEPVYAKNNIAISPGNSAVASPVNNAKTEASFVAHFPKADNAVWAANGKNYFVSFMNEGKKSNASFTAKGKLNYCISTCTIDQLPTAFQKSIRQEYAGYSLLNASQVQAHGITAYEAVLENDKGYKTLKYTVAGVEEITDLKKQ